MYDLMNCCRELALIKKFLFGDSRPLDPVSLLHPVLPSSCHFLSISWAGTHLSREIMVIDMTMGLHVGTQLQSVFCLRFLSSVGDQRSGSHALSLAAPPTFPLPGCPEVPFQMLHFPSFYNLSHLLYS